MESDRTQISRLKNIRIEWTWENWAIIAISLLAFGEMTWLSLQRALGLNALWFDLWVVTQAINSVLSGGMLETSNSILFTNISRLNEHVEIIYFLFSPLFLIDKNPLILLVAQSFLYATGGIAFYLIGRNLKNSKFGLWLAIIYLWYPVAQSAVLFDFHGDTIAMPILAWALYAYSVSAWKQYYLLIGLALLCKVYIVVPVGLLGIILIIKGFKKQGLFTGLMAVVWGIFAIFVIKNLFSVDPMGVIQEYYTLRIDVIDEKFFDQNRLITLIIIFSPLILFFRKGSIWFLPALGIVIPVFFFQGYQYWFHHYALAVPFLVYLIGIEYQKMEFDQLIKKRVGYLVIFSILIFNLLFIKLSGPIVSIKNPFSPYDTLRSVNVIPWVNGIVSEDSVITASPHLSPFLAFRPEIYQTFLMQKELDEHVDLESAGNHSEYFVVDAFFERESIALLDVEKDVLEWLTNANSGFYLQAARDGIFIFSKNHGEEKLWIETQDSKPSEGNSFSMDNGLVLKEAEIDSNYDHNEWNLKIRYIWERSLDLEIPSWYAVTKIVGYPYGRAMHLGPWIIDPVSEWVEGDDKEEFVYINFPHLEGCYPINVGWYDSTMTVVAGDERAIQGEQIIWGYWQMGEKMGEGELVDTCEADNS